MTDQRRTSCLMHVRRGNSEGAAGGAGFPLAVGGPPASDDGYRRPAGELEAQLSPKQANVDFWELSCSIEIIQILSGCVGFEVLRIVLMEMDKVLPVFIDC